MEREVNRARDAFLGRVLSGGGPGAFCAAACVDRRSSAGRSSTIAVTRMMSHDAIRSFAGTFLLTLYLPVPIYMTWIHAGHHLWKRIGPASYVVHLTLYIGMVAAIVRAHEIWRWREWPWPVWISVAGTFLLALAAVLAYETYRTIPARTLLTFRQIQPNGKRRLIRSGVLGKVRHPRYVMYSLLAVGNFCVTGYPLVLVSVAVTLFFLAITIHLEERELRAHFGDEFESYRRSVPAFFPRLKKY